MDGKDNGDTGERKATAKKHTDDANYTNSVSFNGNESARKCVNPVRPMSLGPLSKLSKDNQALDFAFFLLPHL